MDRRGTTEPRTAVLVSCRGLEKRYGDVVAVDGLDLEVRRGECFGLLGPNGAGKTTTIEILEGLLEPDAGEVEVLGLRWGRDDRALRQRLGHPAAGDAAHRQAHRRGDRPAVPLVLPPRADASTTCSRWWSSRRSARAGSGKLSGGQKQRLAVACALVNEPDLLFLDEPTTGLDPQSRRQLWALLDAVPRSGGTILLTTHYMDEAETLCDRVGIVDHGRVIALGLAARADRVARGRARDRVRVSRPGRPTVAPHRGAARRDGRAARQGSGSRSAPSRLHLRDPGAARRAGAPGAAAVGARHAPRHARGRLRGADRDGTCAMSDRGGAVAPDRRADARAAARVPARARGGVLGRRLPDPPRVRARHRLPGQGRGGRSTSA